MNFPFVFLGLVLCVAGRAQCAEVAPFAGDFCAGDLCRNSEITANNSVYFGEFRIGPNRTSVARSEVCP